MKIFIIVIVCLLGGAIEKGYKGEEVEDFKG